MEMKNTKQIAITIFICMILHIIYMHIHEYHNLGLISTLTKQIIRFFF